MELIFLGTSAGVPTRSRNVTAILLDLKHPTRGGLWLFDCGEGTQHQLLHTAYHPGKLDKIFITHLHGDHLFGLPGLLCSRSMAGNANPLTIYGPAGIREFVETTLRLSGSWTDYPLEVVEITEGLVFDDGDYRVTAQPLNHPVECYGYRIEAHDKPGALDAAALMADGVKPGPLFQRLKHGETVTLEDGRVINGQDYLAAPQPGKKLAIFGDTAPCPARSRWPRAWTSWCMKRRLKRQWKRKPTAGAIAPRVRRRSLPVTRASGGSSSPTSARATTRGDAQTCWQSAARCSRNVSWPKISLRLAFSPSFFPQDADND